MTPKRVFREPPPTDNFNPFRSGLVRGVLVSGEPDTHETRSVREVSVYGIQAPAANQLTFVPSPTYPAYERLFGPPGFGFPTDRPTTTMWNDIDSFLGWADTEQFCAAPHAMPFGFQGYIEDAERSFPVPSSSRQESVAMARPIRGRRIERPVNRHIPSRICHKHELLTTAGFLSWHGGPSGTIVDIEDVLISSLYFGSYMYEDTFSVLCTEPPRIPTDRTVDPRGDIFEPISFSGMYIWLNGPSPNPPAWVWFYILPGSGAEAGVEFILGGPDIKRIWGDKWTPQQHVEGMPILPEAMSGFTFGAGDPSLAELQSLQQQNQRSLYKFEPNILS
ncbi:hypothetical protein MFIFM68171_05939 [Madurella fahalii]|uniref:Uncharacterized protein n=1 Tax=Madurella fahalii TaxID=1157608 RepID=A0ABQ0GD83_9PEZI